VSSSPTISGDRVFAGSLTGNVHAMSLMRGDEIWDWKGPAGSAIWASPVAFEDEVIVGVASPYGDKPFVPGRLYALDAASGHQRWSMCIQPNCDPGAGIWSTPAIDETGTAFVGVGNPIDGVMAFDPATGKRKWLASLYADANRDLDVGASPLVFNMQGKEVVAQATLEGTFALLDGVSGTVLWSHPLVAGSAVRGLIASPAFDGAALYVGSASPPTGVFALKPSDGAVMWRHDTDQPVYSAPAAGSGVVVFGTGAAFGDLKSGAILALSVSDGRVVWSYDTRSAVRSGPAIAGDLLVVGDSAGDVITFRPKS
jgi:polyvinyl alcohol dehydrogenase (cytochrome)